MRRTGVLSGSIATLIGLLLGGCVMNTPVVKHVTVEWRHLDVHGRTCDRCGGTGQSVQRAIDDMRRKLSRRGVEITLVEKQLGPDELAKSNEILLNGVTLERVLDARTTMTACTSCATCLGSTSTSCRAIVYRGRVYETIPPRMIRKAILRVVDGKVGCVMIVEASHENAGSYRRRVG